MGKVVASISIEWSRGDLYQIIGDWYEDLSDKEVKELVDGLFGGSVADMIHSKLKNGRENLREQIRERLGDELYDYITEMALGRTAYDFEFKVVK